MTAFTHIKLICNTGSRFSDDIDLDGYFILIPEMDSYEKILKTLGVM